MYSAIRGIYENGTLTLLEPAPTPEKSDVLVTFLQEGTHKITPAKKRVLGGLRHLGGRIPDDFNAPLDDLKDYM